MVLAIIDIIYNMLYINNIIYDYICGNVVYIYMVYIYMWYISTMLYCIPPRFPPPRFPLSRPSTSPRLRVNDHGNDVDAAVHGVVGDNDDADDVDDEGDDQGIQKEEEMVWAKKHMVWQYDL